MTQIDRLRSELGALTGQIAEMTKTKGDSIVATASDVRDAVVDQSDTARLHAMEFQDHATDFVRKNPRTSLGLAVGLGVIAGLLAGRR